MDDEMTIESPPKQEVDRFLVLDRPDWREAADSEWCVQDNYLFTGNETLVGSRTIRGKSRHVWLCLNEEEHVAWFPDGEVETVNTDSEPDFLRFEGKNWKLAGDRKWKPAPFVRRKTLVGSRVIHGVERDVFKEDGFDSYVVALV